MGSSHISLKRIFNRYNKKYCGSRLPADTVVTWEVVKNEWCAYTTKLPDGRWKIALDPSLQIFPKYLRIVMHHEMEHVDKWRASHGRVFKEGIDKKYDAGAYDGLL